jgi:hypothetical protein
MRNIFSKFVLTVGFALAMALTFSCSSDDGGGGNNGGGKDGSGPVGGTFTLTDIPAGREYVSINQGLGGFVLAGCQSIDESVGTGTPVRVTNGKAVIPMWEWTRKVQDVSPYILYEIKGYNGNHTISRLTVNFHSTNTPYFLGADPGNATYKSFNVTFSNGSATKSYND